MFSGISPSELGVIVIIALFTLGPVIAIGVLSRRKNRNWIAWTAFGIFLSLPTLAILAFMPFLCRECKEPLGKDDRKHKKCSSCGAVIK